MISMVWPINRAIVHRNSLLTYLSRFIGLAEERVSKLKTAELKPECCFGVGFGSILDHRNNQPIQ
jgi:hypothetical protein